MEDKRARAYSLLFCFLNFLTRGELKKYLTKALIFLIKARDRLNSRMATIDYYDVCDSYIYSNLTYAIDMINKIFEI